MILNGILKIIFTFLNTFLNSFLIYKIIDFSSALAIEGLNKEKVGIIVQGPVIRKKNFTRNVLKCYSESFPDAIIILSTWEKENTEGILDELPNVFMLKLQEPNYLGIKNINLQIHSTAEALRWLNKKEVRYAVKTRSDQFLDPKKMWLQKSLSTIKLFPTDSNMKSRFITSSLNTFHHRLYGISDMFFFGVIDDMSNFWRITHDSKRLNDVVPEKAELFIRQKTAEGYLIERFFQFVDYEPSWDKKDSNKFISKYFVILDDSELGHFWFKYDYWKQERHVNFLDRKLSFMQWLINYEKYKLELNE
jgi:hypothetical protein